MNEAVNKYVEAHSKSQGLGFILTFLLGPLGLFYSSWVAALILLIVAIVSASTVIGPIICWVLAMIVGFATVSKHNAKVKAAAELGVHNS